MQAPPPTPPAFVTAAVAAKTKTKTGRTAGGLRTPSSHARPAAPPLWGSRRDGRGRPPCLKAPALSRAARVDLAALPLSRLQDHPQYDQRAQDENSQTTPPRLATAPHPPTLAPSSVATPLAWAPCPARAGNPRDTQTTPLRCPTRPALTAGEKEEEEERGRRRVVRRFKGWEVEGPPLGSPALVALLAAMLLRKAPPTLMTCQLPLLLLPLLLLLLRWGLSGCEL